MRPPYSFMLIGHCFWIAAVVALWTVPEPYVPLFAKLAIGITAAGFAVGLGYVLLCLWIHFRLPPFRR
jgi:hypothetical protein